MSDAVRYQDHSDTLDYTAIAAVSGGDVVQLPDGRAGVIPTDLAAAGLGSASTVGIFTVTKKASQVWIKGARIWWDHSANEATCIPIMGQAAGDKDFYLGTAYEDVASATVIGKVELNVRPQYIYDVHRDGSDTAVVMTAGAPYIASRGASIGAAFSATAEAQKLDILSKRSFPVSSNWVFEAIVEVVTTCDADVGDLTVGVANGTHASDAEAITEFAVFHYDLGADLNLDVASDDGTTDVDPTDSTTDWAEGTPLFLCLDGRDHTNVKYYINGVETNAATANLGDITLAAGPLKALFHLEKSSNDSPGYVQLDHMAVRILDNE